MGILTRSLHICLALHLALMLLFSSESFENSLDIKLTAMTDFKQLLTAFERLAYGQSLHTAFTELLDWTLLPFKQYTTVEEQSAALEVYRTHFKVNQLVPLITLIGELSEGFSDPLGELFMLVISSGHNGQFFTPTPICEMISAMSVGETLEDNKTTVTQLAEVAGCCWLLLK
jgi:hypothetical protein